MNIIEVFQSFQTQEQAIEHLEKVRWNGEPNCPYCGSLNCGRHASSDRAMSRWQCRECSRAFSVTIGTLFHGTHVPLRDWFLVLALMLNAKKSASAYQIARDLGKRRATVWSMMQRIRTAMAADPDQERLLHGIVEADETYIGGKAKGKGRGYTGNKIAVVSLVQRGGDVRSTVAERVTGKTITTLLKRHVAAEAHLNTDESPLYTKAGKDFASHATVNHSAEEYGYYDYRTDRTVTTNTVEGFFGNSKRSLDGTHHQISRQHLHLYTAELDFKYNTRKSSDGERTAEGIRRIEGKRLMYKPKVSG